MLNKLLQKGKRLMRSGTRLFASGDGTSCCCDSEPAYQYQECCDGQPRIWVALSAFTALGRSERCDLIHVGNDDDGNPICFHLTGAEATTAELDDAGIGYIRQFNTAVGDGCALGQSCGDGIVTGTCRECPVACCIRAFPPPCKLTPTPPCCVLGNAVQYEWKLTRRELTTGFYHGLSGFTPDGRNITAGLLVEPIREYLVEVKVEGIYVKYNNEGKRCFDIEPYCRITRREFERQYVTDGFRYTNNEDGYVRTITEVIPINPRYEILRDTLTELPCLEPQFYPDVVYADNDPNPALAESVACGASWVRRACASSFPDCPAPGNPWFQQETMNIDGFFSCTGGSQNYRFERINKNNPFGVAGFQDNPHPSGENAITNIVTVQSEYAIRILDDSKCEARSCADIGVGSGPQPLLSPFFSPSQLAKAAGGGCAGCRHSNGL